MRFTLFLVILSAFAVNCMPILGFADETKPEFKKVFDEHGVIGTFVLFDSNKKKFIRYNPKRASTKFTPASTFKIPNTLIGLETGEISGEGQIFKWDGQERSIANWNQDLVLRDAFQFSCVPCYQDVARRVGEKRMKEWVKLIGYGNKDISGGIDRFWLGSSIKISPNKQVDLLRRLYFEKLPFSNENQKLVKRIMEVEKTDSYVLSAKAGFANAGETSIGWYVGFVEKNDNVYFFATNIESKTGGSSFIAARVEITRTLLGELGLL